MTLVPEYKNELKHTWAQAALENPADDVLKRIVRDLNQVEDKDKIGAIIRSCVPLKILSLRDAELLRRYLSADERVELFLKFPQADYLGRETTSIVEKASQDRCNRFWQVARENIKYGSSVRSCAPNHTKDAKLQKQQQSSQVERSSELQAGSLGSALTTDWAEQLKEDSVEEVLTYALKVCDSLKYKQRKEFAERLPPELLKIPNARRLRQALGIGRRIGLYSENIRQKDCLDFWIDELGQVLKCIDLTNEKQFWQSVVNDIPSDSKALQLAPENIKRKVLERGFENYFESLRKLRQSALKSNFSAIFTPKQVYSIFLKDSDKELARRWVKFENKDDEHETAKMLSARSAEKAASYFYKKLGYRVEDTAITQLEDREEVNDWKRYDLLLDEQIAVDVKNARTPAGGDIYIEHTVLKFKKDRRLEDVVIAGVQSPYLRLEYIKSPASIPSAFKKTDIIFLGETTQKKLNDLQTMFQTNHLDIVLIKGSVSKTFIPPWIFEYPKRFYNQEVLNSSRLESYMKMKAPPLSIIRELGFEPLPVYLASGLPFPEEWFIGLSNYQTRLVKRLERREEFRHSLAYVFLSVLSHFLEMLREEKEDDIISFSHIFETVFFSKCADSRQPLDFIANYPLGIYDPLHTVFNLCTALGILWQNRYENHIQNLTSFKLDGKELLRGRHSSAQDFTTLLAYCGGLKVGQVKCGYSPLIVGEHETCSRCGKLICKECGFCSQGCKRLVSNLPEINSVTSDVQRLLNYYEHGDYECYDQT